jgi:hypothetical protein
MTDLPKPQPGLVIHFSYLWRYQDKARQEEGEKDRPCVVLYCSADQRVYVCPVTHRRPDADDGSVQIPPRVKQHLRLDHDSSWIVVNECNSFYWPGFDLRKGPSGRFDYGFLPPNLFADVRNRFVEMARAKRLVDVRR